MKCENCGEEILNHAKFCPHCGAKTYPKVAGEKSMITALILSFIFVGTGIAYAGKKQKGISLFFIGLIFAVLAMRVPICTIFALIVWIYSLYETYMEVRVANGVSDPHLLEDIRSFPTNKKIAAGIIIAIVFLMLIGGVIAALSTTHDGNDSTYDDLSDYYVFDNDESSGDDGYDSYSDGDDVHYHYEDEYGSSDINGKVYDDGSVESHQTGHTDYGDYQIDSFMDSDGNLHGTVETGGKTYRVED